MCADRGLYLFSTGPGPVAPVNGASVSTHSGLVRPTTEQAAHPRLPGPTSMLGIRKRLGHARSRTQGLLGLWERGSCPGHLLESAKPAGFCHRGWGRGLPILEETEHPGRGMLQDGPSTSSLPTSGLRGWGGGQVYMPCGHLLLCLPPPSSHPAIGLCADQGLLGS